MASSKKRSLKKIRIRPRISLAEIAKMAELRLEKASVDAARELEILKREKEERDWLRQVDKRIKEEEKKKKKEARRQERNRLRQERKRIKEEEKKKKKEARRQERNRLRQERKRIKEEKDRLRQERKRFCQENGLDYNVYIRSIYARKYRAEYAKEIRERHRLYRKTEKYKAQQRRYRQTEKYKEQKKRYRERHKDHLKAYYHEWYLRRKLIRLSEH